MMRSIRLRLFLILLAATGAVWLLAVFWTYLSTQREVERVLDARLTEAARMVSSLITDHHIDVAAAVDAARTASMPDGFNMHDGDYSRQLSCQIWSLQGDLVSRSESAPGTSLADHQTGFAEKLVNGERWRVYAVVNPELGVRVLVGDNIEIRERLVGDVIKGQLIPALAILPVLAGLIWLSVERGLSPLRRTADTLSLRSADELHAVDDSGAPREIRPLLSSLNALFQRVQEAREREKTFIAYAAHELKTPLSGLKTQAQIALRSDNEKVRANALNQISLSVDRTGRLVRQLIDLASVDSLENPSTAETVAIKAMVEELNGELTALRSAREITVESQIAEEPLFKVPSKALLRLALRNVLENALQYSPRGSIVRIDISVSDNTMTVSVSDQGTGIDERDEKRLMARFQRGSSSDATGSGLGLSIVEMATTRLGGSISFVRHGNFCVRLIIPLT
ncbi:ATP-binding protein [Rhizobium paknamense]|uniref:histidine kinase n=1 Tax=Rhizobium paknamense TaxID=1206817 RepID=A0ABU0IJ56_9HYPH|nr:ATP-binding protein [Rhizobium paknamense]MDQ0457460.1 two-component system sensor histidine kinase QseC [Rhizobium paknamense]